MKRWLILIVLAGALVLAGCTRSLSDTPTDVTTDDSGDQISEDAAAPDSDTASQETAIAGTFVTQTAIAQTQSGEGGDSGATDDPQATEVPADPAAGDDDAAAGDAGSDDAAAGGDTGTDDADTSPPADEGGDDAQDDPPPADDTGDEGGETPTACVSPYEVSQGEWIYSIGRKCNIHPNAIIDANNLFPPYTLYPGDILTLPENAAPFPTGG